MRPDSIAKGVLRGLALALLIEAVPESGAAGADPTSGEVRVYTNADLERLGPLPEEPGPTETTDPGDWDFVTEFLEREYARLDAEREHALERNLGPALGNPARPTCYGHAFWPARYGYGARSVRPMPSGPDGPRPYRAPELRPLHAGPTSAQTQRARAIRPRTP